MGDAGRARELRCFHGGAAAHALVKDYREEAEIVDECRHRWVRPERRVALTARDGEGRTCTARYGALGYDVSTMSGARASGIAGDVGNCVGRDSGSGREPSASGMPIAGCRSHVAAAVR